MTSGFDRTGARRAGPAESSADLKALEARRKQLESALAEFRHSARRVRDGLERSGGRNRELERQTSLLAENESLTLRELRQTEVRINEIRRRLSGPAAD